MKAAFIHDHYFVHNPTDGKYYDGSGGVFDEKLWNRYLAIFDSLIVIGRQKEDLPNKLVDSTCANVTFELRDELKTSKDRFLKKALVKKNLEKTLAKVDFAIIRLPSVLGYIAQEICEESKIKYTLEVVTCPWDAYWNYGSLAGKIVAPLEFFKLRNACKKALNVIYVTESFLQSRYPTTNNQINISNVLIQEKILLESAVEFYQKPIDIFKIGLIGSFHVKWKGHIEAIKAVKFLIDKGIINIRLYLVGTGNSDWVKDIIDKEGVTDYIEIVGVLESGKKGILPFLDALHLYIHPSKQEGLPRVMIEALSRGRLVLGSTAAGIPELLEEKYLHAPGDYKTLAKQILAFYDEKNNRKEIIRNNWNKSSNYLEEILQHKRITFLSESSSRI